MKRGSAEPRAHSRPEASAARTLCVYTIGYPQLRGQVYEFMYTVAYGDIWLPRPMYIARETGFLNHVQKRDFLPHIYAGARVPEFAPGPRHTPGRTIPVVSFIPSASGLERHWLGNLYSYSTVVV